jgi:hypothetical protein
MPPPDDHEVVVWGDEDRVAPRPLRLERVGRQRLRAAARIEPPQEAVVGNVFRLARFEREFDVFAGNQLLVTPLAAAQPQIPEPGHV